MKNILNAPFVDEMKKATANMYRLGWDERNGGNISYMLEEEQVAEYLERESVTKNYLDEVKKYEEKVLVKRI